MHLFEDSKGTLPFTGPSLPGFYVHFRIWTPLGRQNAHLRRCACCLDLLYLLEILKFLVYKMKKIITIRWVANRFHLERQLWLIASGYILLCWDDPWAEFPNPTAMPPMGTGRSRTIKLWQHCFPEPYSNTPLSVVLLSTVLVTRSPTILKGKFNK